MISRKTHFLTQEILRSSLKGAVAKLRPSYMIKNPVMFVVEVGFVLTFFLAIIPADFQQVSQSSQLYNGIVSGILLLTLLFANFAESIAEGRGKAQALSLIHI